MSIRTTETFVWNHGYIAMVLTQLGAATPTLTGLDDCTVHLFSGSTVPTPTSITADFTEAVFTGYGADTVTTLTTVNTSTAQRALYGNCTFSLTGGPPVVGETITGYFVLDSDDLYVGGERFGAAVNLANSGDWLDLNVLLPMNLIVAVPDQE